MKPFIFLLVSFFVIIDSFAQSSGPKPLSMSIEKEVIKNNEPEAVILQFKPGEALKIKIAEGKMLRSANYVYQESAIVMVTLTENDIDKSDTIPFQDIVKIRGKVYGNADRKVAGTILALGGLPLTVMGFVVATIASSPAGAVVMMQPGV